MDDNLTHKSNKTKDKSNTTHQRHRSLGDTPSQDNHFKKESKDKEKVKDKEKKHAKKNSLEKKTAPTLAKEDDTESYEFSSLKELVEDPIGYEAFKDFLLINDCVENLLVRENNWALIIDSIIYCSFGRQLIVLS